MSGAFVIIGAGGHARVLADALCAGGASLLGFTDPDASLHGRVFCGAPVLGDDGELSRWTPAAVTLVNGLGGIGAQAAGFRARLQSALEGGGWRFAGVRHPSAIVSRFATLADDVQVLAQGVVQAGAHIARGCILNTGCIVEHDVQVEEFSHVAPRALLCGDVRIGAGTHVGAGAVVRQGIVLGPRTVVGAGAVVVKAFAGDGLLVGVPATHRGGTR
jgi:sugar O-acyltransferase (sialic acid O-acetyltransferase NeuD family)